MIISALYGSGVGPVSDTYSLQITPANYAFFIWWVIYFFGGLYWLYGLVAPNDSYLLSSIGERINLINSYDFSSLTEQVLSHRLYKNSCSYTFVSGSLWHSSVIGVKFSLLQVFNIAWILVFNIGNDVSIIISCLISIAMLVVLTYIEVDNQSFFEIRAFDSYPRRISDRTNVLFGPFYTPCDHLCRSGVVINRRVSSWMKSLVVDLTFSIEQSWLIVATSLGISMVLKLIWDPSDDVAKWVSMAILIVLYCISGWYAYSMANPYTTLVSTWAYIAIYVNSTNDVVSYTSLILGILLFVEFVGYIFYYASRMSVRFTSNNVGRLATRTE
jgi:hypothetical protein